MTDKIYLFGKAIEQIELTNPDFIYVSTKNTHITDFITIAEKYNYSIEIGVTKYNNVIGLHKNGA